LSGSGPEPAPTAPRRDGERDHDRATEIAQLLGDGDWSRAEPAPQRREADDPPPFPPFERTGSRQLYRSPWCGLRQDFLRLPDGREQDYHVFEVSNAVAVVPVLADGRMRLIWQYRYPHGRSHWEVPAGRIHGGEPPAEAAQRELREEAGCVCARLVRLPGFFPTNGISDHYAHAYLALGCVPVGEPQLDPAERLSLRDFPVAEVRRRLWRGDFADGFTALSLFYALVELDAPRA
jgi:8-oxo-dGTP pyrophosphatase MutT (NUDIX family)